MGRFAVYFPAFRERVKSILRISPSTLYSSISTGPQLLEPTPTVERCVDGGTAGSKLIGVSLFCEFLLGIEGKRSY